MHMKPFKLLRFFQVTINAYYIAISRKLLCQTLKEVIELSKNQTGHYGQTFWLCLIGGVEKWEDGKLWEDGKVR